MLLFDWSDWSDWTVMTQCRSTLQTRYSAEEHHDATRRSNFPGKLGDYGVWIYYYFLWLYLYGFREGQKSRSRRSVPRDPFGTQDHSSVEVKGAVLRTAEHSVFHLVGFLVDLVLLLFVSFLGVGWLSFGVSFRRF